MIGVARVALAGLAVVQLSGSFSAAQSWNVELATSTVTLTGNSFADDGINPPIGTPPDLQAGANSGFIAGYNGGAGMHHYGQDVYVVANDGFLSSESGLNWVTIDGQLSNTLEIDWRAYAEPEVAGDLPPYLGTALSALTADIDAQLTNLIPGALYEILYDWSYTVDAQANHEDPLLREDPEMASTNLTFDLGGGGPGFVFGASADSETPVDFESDSGSGMFFLIAAATPEDLLINLAARASARIDDPLRPIALDDRADAAGRGHLRIVVNRIVPEPASVVLFVLALGSLMLARGKNR